MNARTSTIDPTYGIPTTTKALARFERMYPDRQAHPRSVSVFGTLAVLIEEF